MLALVALRSWTLYIANSDSFYNGRCPEKQITALTWQLILAKREYSFFEKLV